MQTPPNRFKQSLLAGRLQIGLWVGLGNAYCTEICAGAGFDWVLIDGEHGPQHLPGVLGQLQAVAAYPDCHAVVRVPSADATTLKEHLDIGATTLLVPMVETADEAMRIVDACRYPPAGSRGVGGGRAAGWGRYADYLSGANDRVCILVQVETMKAVAHLEAIAAVDGIDGVFVGPVDLAASMGHLGNPGHEDVQRVVFDVFRRLKAMDKPAGILTRDEDLARRQVEAGARFVAVGADSLILSSETSALAARFADLPRG
jgi:4-hydroxy-2-oxoheptanedioate aldolase